jgi:hypothetical protein
MNLNFYKHPLLASSVSTHITFIPHPTLHPNFIKHKEDTKLQEEISTYKTLEITVVDIKGRSARASFMAHPLYIHYMVVDKKKCFGRACFNLLLTFILSLGAYSFFSGSHLFLLLLPGIKQFTSPRMVLGNFMSTHNLC